MLISRNRKATFDYEIIDKYIAGMILKGHEVKALREKKVNMDGSYIKPMPDGLYVVGMHIGRYSSQSQKYMEENSRAPRKILLTNRETFIIRRALEEKGKTAVPLAVLLKNNLLKLEIATVKGRQKEGKKVVAKERQIKMDLAREAKQYRKLV
ncbi:SsrA-binding protein [candidate division WWE3 bacterium]|nr:SsrA-binding protein [candidate division WWE3 bacterium]